MLQIMYYIAFKNISIIYLFVCVFIYLSIYLRALTVGKKEPGQMINFMILLCSGSTYLERVHG